jgi:hypothetical protein
MVDQNKNQRTLTPPDLTEVLEATKRDMKIAINCVQIGIIQAFDTSTQLATIQIAMKQVKDVAEDGTRTVVEYPLILECPVMVLFGGVDVLTLPIAAGDNCIVLFCDRDIDQWLNNGNDKVPTTSRAHDMNDAFAIVGIRPLTNSIANYLSNGIRLSHGTGNSQIDLKTDLIDSIADLFLHHGSMRITENLEVDGDLTVIGDVYGNGSNTINLKANLYQNAAYVMKAGNGATGTFNIVTVANGIVVSGI